MSLNSTPGDAAAESYFSIDRSGHLFRRPRRCGMGGGHPRQGTGRAARDAVPRKHLPRKVGRPDRDADAGARLAARGRLAGWPRPVVRLRLDTFPLYDVNGWQIDSTTIPAQVKYAAMEAALLALGGTALEPTLERGGQIKSIDKSVGPIRKAIVYADGAPARDTYTAIDGYLRGLVNRTTTCGWCGRDHFTPFNYPRIAR
jgi:hypothetical protein